MADSTLTALYTELQQVIGLYANWGLVYNNWRADQKTLGDLFVKEGVAQFYTPPPTDIFPRGHQWSFLHPRNTIDVWPSVSANATLLSYSAPNTSITVLDPTFYSNMVGESVVFPGTGNSYPIAVFTNSQLIEVTGDASGEDPAFTITADGNYNAPDSFAGVYGPLMTFVEQNVDRDVAVVSDTQVNLKRQMMSYGGRPELIAFRAIANTGLTEQRWEFMVWPLPDIYYQLEYRQILAAGKVTNSLAYHLGGAPHSAAVKQSCLARAELKLKGGQGPEYAQFMRDLNASILFDLQSNRVSNLGLNRDQSDGQDRMIRSRISGNVTYNGSV